MTCVPALPVAPVRCAECFGRLRIRGSLRYDRRRRPLRYNHKSVIAAIAKLLSKLLRDLGQVIRNFRDQGHIGVNRDGRLQRQPAGMFAQEFHDADLPCRLRRLPGTVEGLRGIAQGAVEAKRQHRRCDIVFD